MGFDIKNHYGIAKYDFMLNKIIVLPFFPVFATSLGNNSTICQKSCSKYTSIRL